MRSSPSATEPDELYGELASLPELGPERLKERWRILYGTEPPPRISEDLLRRAIAYRLQERASAASSLPHADCSSGLPTTHDRARHRPRRHRKLSAGTVLIREWHGASHQVTVLEDGVLFRGKRYRSLSEVARKITGSRWSGPLFFGLKAPAEEQPRWNAVKPQARRCAIYTRKSSEEGLEQDFNSLHAQREACEAFIKSQAGEGWRLVKTAYDDGGLLGRHAWSDRPCSGCWPTSASGSIDVGGGLQGRSADPLARRLRQDGRAVRRARRVLRRGHPAVQYHHLDGTADAQRAARPSPSSSARSPANGSATRSPPPSARACGWAACVPLGYDVRDRSLVINHGRGQDRPRYLPALPGTRQRRGCSRTISTGVVSSPRFGSPGTATVRAGSLSLAAPSTRCSPTRSTSARSGTAKNAIPDSTRRS